MAPPLATTEAVKAWCRRAKPRAGAEPGFTPLEFDRGQTVLKDNKLSGCTPAGATLASISAQCGGTKAGESYDVRVDVQSEEDVTCECVRAQQQQQQQQRSSSGGAPRFKC
jgi:hypothetical protein